MRNNKLHTPDGVRDLLPFDCLNKLNTERKIEAVFHKYGYNNIETPTFEYYEVFSDAAQSVRPEQMYKFFDRDGSILALKADMTLPIARVAATAYNENELPLRLCYIGNAFKYNENYQGKLREYTQAGVELIGINSQEADAEILSLAVNGIIETGLKEFKVYVGQVDFFRGILEEAGFDDETSKKIQNMIAEKDYIAIEETLKNMEISENIKSIFVNLHKLVGSLEILHKIKKLVTNEKSLKALEKLEKLYSILEAYGIEKYIVFDLAMVTHLNYYTGIIFRGYTYGTGFSILDGGRYDNLISEFGMNTPAVGFAIRVNDILTALDAQSINIEKEKADTLLIYSEQGRNTALRTAEELRNTGLFIENGFIQDIDKAEQYCKSKGLGGILYFSDNENVEIINVQTGEHTKTTVNELIQK